MVTAWKANQSMMTTASTWEQSREPHQHCPPILRALQIPSRHLFIRLPSNCPLLKLPLMLSQQCTRELLNMCGVKIMLLPDSFAIHCNSLPSYFILCPLSSWLWEWLISNTILHDFEYFYHISFDPLKGTIQLLLSPVPGILINLICTLAKAFVSFLEYRTRYSRCD